LKHAKLHGANRASWRGEEICKIKGGGEKREWVQEGQNPPLKSSTDSRQEKFILRGERAQEKKEGTSRTESWKGTTR